MLIEGKKIAKVLEEKLTTELLFSVPKKVCFIIIGDNMVTEQFVKAKCRVAERIGVIVEVKRYEEVSTTKKAREIVQKVGEMDIDGIVVQLPLPAGIDVQAVLDEIPPEKDIDLLGARAIKRYVNAETNRVPPVAQAVREIFDYYDILIKGKNIVLVGQGRLVGMPIHMMFQKEGTTHSIVTTDTPSEDRANLLLRADIIISGTGAPNSIDVGDIKEGVILIDAGSSEQQGKLVGDINPVCGVKALWFASVPGGIGPVTIASLFRNLTIE